MAYLEIDSRKAFHIYPCSHLQVEVVVPNINTIVKNMATIIHPQLCGLLEITMASTRVKTKTTLGHPYACNFMQSNTKLAMRRYRQVQGVVIGTRWVTPK